MTDMNSIYDDLRTRLMAVGIRDAAQATVDALKSEYGQRLVTESQTIERVVAGPNVYEDEIYN